MEWVHRLEDRSVFIKRRFAPPSQEVTLVCGLKGGSAIIGDRIVKNIKMAPVVFIVVMVLFCSCRAVFYADHIEENTGVNDQMNSLSHVGPITIENAAFNARLDEVYFIPEQGLYNRGFVVWERSDTLSLWYVDESGRLSNGIDVSPGIRTDTDNEYVLSPLEDNPAKLLVICFYHERESGGLKSIMDVACHEDGILLWKNASSGTPVSLDGFIFDAFGGSIGVDSDSELSVNGAYISPHTHRLYLLCCSTTYAPSSYRYYEASCAINDEGDLVDPLLLRTEEDNLYWIQLSYGGEEAFFYAYDSMSGSGYANYFDQSASGYRTYTWNFSDTASGSAKSIGIREPVLHFLSTSCLYTRKGDVVEIYHASGSVITSFYTEDLRFNYEIENSGGKFMMVFSETTTRYISPATFNFRMLTYNTDEIEKLTR
ncbi:MAG: hypothetical protein JW881_22170 [Spirochaetales bacterium]|nr:hypothetical protein [Spirochaetales bacterium]